MLPELLIYLAILETLFIVLFCGVFLKTYQTKKRLKRQMFQLTEMLATAPYGIFYFSLLDKKQVCSRRLAVLLGIYEAHPSFDTILKKLSVKSKADLQKAVSCLQKTGKEFSLSLTTVGENVFLQVQGQCASDVNGTVLADVLWFSDLTELKQRNAVLEKDVLNYQLRDNLFVNALDGLPFAFWLRNSDLSLAYCNKAYLSLVAKKDREEVLKNNIELSYEASDKMGAKLLAIAAKNAGEGKSEKGQFLIDKKLRLLEVCEVPLGKERAAEDRFSLGFTKDIQNEQNLKISLENYLKAQYQVLGALNAGIVIFDSNAYIQFYNHAFANLWKLDEDWLITGPSFAAVLDKLREKRLLPEEGNFLRYKHQELEQFSKLATLQEEMFYLPNGRIYRRTMTPYPLGGVVMTFDDVSDKVSLERLYNAEIVNQKKILNQMPLGILLFNEEGRLKSFNQTYLDLFNMKEEFLKTEPLLLDVLDEQKNALSVSDDIWEILRPKILIALEDENGYILLEKAHMHLHSVRLPDGGVMLMYEKLPR